MRLPWRLSPDGRQGRPQPLDGVAAQGGPIAGAGRPAGAVAQHLLQAPGGFHGERWGRQALEGQHQIAVAALHQGLFGWPVGADDIAIEVLQQGVGRPTLQPGDAVAPDGQHPAGAQHPFQLPEEPGPIEPVHRLGHRGQVDAVCLQAGALRRRQPVADPGMGAGGGELGGAGVGGHHFGEMGGQADGGLARSGGAVPGPLAGGSHRRQPVEQGRRVGGAEVGVGPGDGAEMIDERSAHRPMGTKNAVDVHP